MSLAVRIQLVDEGQGTTYITLHPIALSADHFGSDLRTAVYQAADAFLRSIARDVTGDAVGLQPGQMIAVDR